MTAPKKTTRTRPKPAQRVSAIRIDAARRRKVALELKYQDLTYQEVADEILRRELGPKPRKGSTEPKYSRSDAYRDIQLEMRDITLRPATELKARQNYMLARTQRRLMIDVLSRNADPADRARSSNALMKNLEREARLNGLDEATKLQFDITSHYDTLAQIAAGAIGAAVEAMDATPEQRVKALAAISDYMSAIEHGEATVGVKQLDSVDEIMDAELVDEAG